MNETELKELFILDEDEIYFKNARKPKSCGGGDEFKHLALYGDNMINLALLENFTDYFQFELENLELELKILKRKSLTIEDLWEIIYKSFK